MTEKRHHGSHHDNQSSIKCTECGKAFTSEKEYQEHLEKQHHGKAMAARAGSGAQGEAQGGSHSGQSQQGKK